MIEIHDSKGYTLHRDRRDIKEIKKYFHVKYPSIRCTVELYDGEIIKSCMSVNTINNLMNGHINDR